MIHSNAILIIWGPNSFGGKVKNSKYLFGGKTHQILKWFSMCSTRIPIPNKVFILIYNNHFKHCFYWVRPWQLNSLGRFTHLWNRMNEYQGDCWFQKESSVWIKRNSFCLLSAFRIITILESISTLLEGVFCKNETFVRYPFPTISNRLGSQWASEYWVTKWIPVYNIVEEETKVPQV